jgi:hypothetical protein
MDHPGLNEAGEVPEYGAGGPVEGPEVVARFLCEQSELLTGGLASADDSDKVVGVVASHEASHATWLRLIADAEQWCAPDTLDELLGLYSLHGWVVGILKRRVGSLLSAELASRVRSVVADELTERTDALVARLLPVSRGKAAESPAAQPPLATDGD